MKDEDEGRWFFSSSVCANMSVCVRVKSRESWATDLLFLCVWCVKKQGSRGKKGVGGLLCW